MEPLGILKPSLVTLLCPFGSGETQDTAWAVRALNFPSPSDCAHDSGWRRQGKSQGLCRIYQGKKHSLSCSSLGGVGLSRWPFCHPVGPKSETKPHGEC